MFMKLLKIIKEYIHNRPKIKKTIGIILILVGLASLSSRLSRPVHGWQLLVLNY